MRGALAHRAYGPREKPDNSEERALFDEWYPRVLAWRCTRCRHFMESCLLCKAMAGEPMDVTVQGASCPQNREGRENSI